MRECTGRPGHGRSSPDWRPVNERCTSDAGKTAYLVRRRGERSPVTWAEANGRGDLSYDELIRLEDLRAEIERTVEDVNKRLARFETIKKFALLPAPLEVEAGELTPTLKVRRKVVEEKYKSLLDGLYE